MRLKSGGLLTTYFFRHFSLNFNNYYGCKPFNTGITCHHSQNRLLSTKFDQTKSSSTPSILDEWKTIYRFNHIIPARAIQRLKIYQTGVTCFVFLPWCLTSSYLGLANPEVAYIGLGTSVLACVMLGIMGTFASRVIGILYLNKANPNQMRIARLSFFGSRIDHQVPSNYFVPITDSSENVGDSYIVLETVEPKLISPKGYKYIKDFLPEEKYYISLRYGTVLDKEAFISIFGDVSSYLVEKKQ